MERSAIKTPIAAADLESALTSAWFGKFGSEPPTNAIAVLMSQSALETGSWNSCVCFNLGNVKSKVDADGDWTFFTTWEQLPASEVAALVAASTPAAPVRELSPTKAVFEPKHPMCCFRAFGSLVEAATWYLNFLFTHFAPAWAAVLDGDPFEFVHQLKLHGYFTADESAYLSGVVRFFDTFGTPPLSDNQAICEALRTLGYDVSDYAAAVGAFQQATGLVVDKAVGPLTRAKLRVALSRADQQ